MFVGKRGQDNVRDHRFRVWGAEGRRGTNEILTHVILQAELEFGPEHDEGEGSIEVNIVRVVHAIFLAWRKEGDTVRIPAALPNCLPSLSSRVRGGRLSHSTSVTYSLIPTNTPGLAKPISLPDGKALTGLMDVVCHTMAHQQPAPSR